MFKICIYSLFTTKDLGYQVFDLCNAPSGAIWIWPPPFVNLMLVPDVVISRTFLQGFLFVCFSYMQACIKMHR